MTISEKDKYEIYRDYIKHEDSLINNQLTWLLVVQRLIFSAYSGLTTTMVNVYAGCDESCLTNMVGLDFLDSKRKPVLRQSPYSRVPLRLPAARGRS